MLMKIVILLWGNESHMAKNLAFYKIWWQNGNIFYKNFMGVMLMKIVILLRENQLHITKKISMLKKLITKLVAIVFKNEKNVSDQWFRQKFDGGDASENCDFQRGKQRLHWCKIFEIFEYHKMALLFRWTKNLKLKNKTCQEVSKITKWHYFLDELNLKFKNKTCHYNYW